MVNMEYLGECIVRGGDTCWFEWCGCVRISFNLMREMSDRVDKKPMVLSFPSADPNVHVLNLSVVPICDIYVIGIWWCVM